MLTDCSWGLPAKWNMETELTSIPAALQVTFKIKIPCNIPDGSNFCTVYGLDLRGVIVAERLFKIVKNNICICTFYCNCACLKSVTGLQCLQMSRPMYNAAGFKGSLPLTRGVVRITFDEAMALGAFTFILLLVIILFLLGLAKALIGKSK